MLPTIASPRRACKYGSRISSQHSGPARILMCSLQAGLNQAAAIVGLKGQLTCKDSLLVGWGGATDQDQSSCHIVCAAMPGSLIKMQRCTLQYHPDSKHTLGSDVVLVSECGHVALSQCRLIGPAPGNASPMRAGIGAMRGGTATMVRSTVAFVAQVQRPAAHMLGS
jgi:hypothetical protein